MTTDTTQGFGVVFLFKRIANLHSRESELP